MPAAQSAPVTPATLHGVLGAIGQAATKSVAITAATMTATPVAPTSTSHATVVPVLPLSYRFVVRPVSPTAERANIVPHVVAVTPVAATFAPVGPAVHSARSVPVTPVTRHFVAVTPTIA